jgi:Arc/MetJ-type ribon-helix-helix transcriptional regulator
MWYTFRVVTMSKQIHDGEGDRRKQVKARADAAFVDEFDEWVEQSSEYSNRSEAIRAGMSRLMGAQTDGMPLEPPQQSEALHDGYETLVEIANRNGYVPHDLAVNELQTALSKSQAVVEHTILGKLWDRGYIRSVANFSTSERSWKLVGVDDE